MSSILHKSIIIMIISVIIIIIKEVGHENGALRFSTH